MNTDTDLEPDPEDQTAHGAPQQMPALGKVYTFQGKTLQPFSSARYDLHNRLTFESHTRGEGAALLVYICLQSKERCVTIRGEKEVERFRVEFFEWLDTVGWLDRDPVKREGIATEMLTIYRDVRRDIGIVEAVEPDVKGTGTPGNS